MKPKCYQRNYIATVDIAPEVIRFISEFTSVSVEKITPTMLINSDLGIDGDDGLELLEAFSKKFRVDLRSMAEHHFGAEGLSVLFIMHWYRTFIRWATGDKAGDLVPLSVAQLIESAETGRWGNAGQCKVN